MILFWSAVAALCALTCLRWPYIWVSLLGWCLVLVVFLFFTRAYLAPYVLTRFSDHIRVRSVSLRSIRGLYFRKGNKTWHIERFAYAYSVSGDGKAKGLSFRIEDFKLEVELAKAPQVIPRARHRRGLTLSDLSPSPLALYIWSMMSYAYTAFEPVVRPATRLVVTSVLRQVIRLIPRLTETLQLEVDRAVVLSTSAPEVCFVAENITLKGHVSFIQNSQDQHIWNRNQVSSRQTLTARALATGAWKPRLVNSFHRTWTSTWDHTLGLTTGSMAFDLVIGNLGSGHGQKDGFVRLSKPLVATGAARFSPRNGALEPGTLQSHVKMGAAHVDIDAFQGLLSTWRVLESEDIRSPGASMSSTRVRGAFSASSGSSEYLALLSEKQEKKRTPVPLGLVQSMRFDFGSLTFSKMITGKRYRIVIQDGSCSCLPSNGTSDSVHRTWLGKSLPISTSAYRFSLTLQHISLQRTDIAAWINGANSAIISTGSISIQSIISNWPALTAVDPLLSSSSNTRVLLDVQVTSLSFTDRLDHLLQLAGDRSLKDAPQRGIEPVLPAVLSPVPEIVLNVAIGPVTANVKCANPANAEEPIVMDLEMNGMTFDSSSSFFTGPSVVALRGRYNADNEHIPLRMTMPFHCLLHPVFLRLRSTSTKKTRKRMSRWGLESALGDTVFSLETLEVNGTLAGLGELCEEDEPVLAALNTRTLFADLHCRTEAAFVELWHPRRLEFLNNLLSVLSACRCATTSHQSPRIPPIGYSLSLSVARAVLFVTGPDVNPAADADITRGVAFSTGISSRICVVGTDHTQTLRPSQSDSQNRQKLFLPPDKLGDAISFARASEVPTGSVIFGKLMFWNTSIRSAAADQFSMDDPLMFESDNPSLHVKRIVFVQNTNIDIKYTPQQSRSKGAECDMAFTVDNFTLFFELPFVHSALVAFRTLRSIKQAIEPSILSPTLEGHSPPFTYTNIHGTIKAFRARLGLLDQKVTMRANYLDLSSSSRGLHCSVDSLLFWVPVVPPKGQANKEMSWEELGRLNRFSLSSATPFAGHTNINMDSLRVRIPYGYALANLSQAAVITLKAVRHLAKMVILGKYSPVPAPVAESAKRLPDLTVACQVLSLEAADDPFESQLGFNCRLGLEAARSRLRREEAFEAKASAVLSGQSLSAHSTHTDYQFDSNHSVPVEEARWRLNMAHSVDWILRHRRQSREREIQEDSFRQVHGSIPLKRPTKVPDLIHPAEPQRTPPLIRIILTGLRSSLSRPSFSLEGLPDFLYEQGKGIPRETSYSLLVPMHLTFTLVSLQVLLRDYPLPLLYVPPVASSNVPSLHFDSDLVIAEEMGPPVSVEWVPCLFHDPDEIVTHNAPMLIKVPKTLMPVKTYARPLLQVTAHDPVAFAWGVSYSPAIQDVVRMLESITPESRDISLPLGFWDKFQLRLVFHWTIHVSFKEEVRLYLKGSRDPYVLENEGAGFALCWHGDPQIKIGFENSAGELAQVTSDTMLIVIPKFDYPQITPLVQGRLVSRTDYIKVCAKLSSGTMFGVGLVFERTCGPDCRTCTGSAFDRHCRLFTFRPHHNVQLVGKSEVVGTQTHWDSYREFRSDFLHLSISLASGLRTLETAKQPLPNSIHLTPKTFTNFWSWWGLFDNDLSVPIRHATIKYRVSLPRLFITHVYLDDTKESWVNGTTCFVGMKGRVSHLQADLHQREQETIAPGNAPDSIQVVRHKPFYAAEVVMKDLDVRVLEATFSEPLKQAVPMSIESERDARNNISSGSDVPSSWQDIDDFVETDWSSQQNPCIQLLPILSCPKLTYFRKHSQHAEIQAENSKFGDEATHTCLLGCEPSVSHVEIGLAEARVTALQRMIDELQVTDNLQRQAPLGRMIVLLQEYIAHLQEVDQPTETALTNHPNYYMPSDMVTASEWADFENVYQIHAPNLFLCEYVRDLLIQYYNCSKARRGFEYHMATRAVKFLRDQADMLASHLINRNAEKSKGPVNAAQVAASALRRILTRERGSTSLDIRAEVSDVPMGIDPLDGWEEGIVLRKSHFCLLLKPQIILRTAGPSVGIREESTVVLAAVQAKLQSFQIMDTSNLEDPVSGTIMTRNYMSLNGLQTFCPTVANAHGDGPVPLEVLIDYRCESDTFDRIVPQTNSTCQYDRFNRLRLRNKVTSTGRPDKGQLRKGRHAHLYDETDLIQVHVPQFTVSASDRHFQFISDIITNLVLFSDVAHKARLEKLETLLFAYDFTDLRAAAKVVSDLQNRLRNVIDTYDDVSRQLRGDRSQSKLELLKLQAHTHLLVEELNLIFDAIRLAQCRTDDSTDQKSALLLRASSSEISWRMLDEHRELLAKLAVRNIDFTWLSKQDSSTASSLTMGDLQAFDGSPHAIWTEIVSKYEEPSNHPLSKRDLFLDANWVILAPVGGITVYEKFLLDFHPIRLQLDARIGQRIMEYIWPSRRGRNRKLAQGMQCQETSEAASEENATRSSFDSPHMLRKPRTSLDSNGLTPWKKLGGSRSCTDLRSAAAESAQSSHPTRGAEPDSYDDNRVQRRASREARKDDAIEMKSRSSQKTFILVKISSLELLLSIMKAESFECRDARICTHTLEIRNQTWSFEELVDQFIPTDLTWKGWVRMAFQQPLVPVLPVARELFSKTKLIASKSATQLDPRPSSNRITRRGRSTATDDTVREKRPRRSSSSSNVQSAEPALTGSVIGLPVTEEPETIDEENIVNERDPGNSYPRGRTRLLSVFSRNKRTARSSSLQTKTDRDSLDEPANVSGDTYQ